MIVTVKGTVMSMKEVEKNGKKSTDVMLYQDGEQSLARVRYTDLTKGLPKLGDMIQFTGYLRTWASQNGSVGSMVSQMV